MHAEVGALTDAIYADVSEWQAPVDDRYPHRVLCIRANDGDHRDLNWDANYHWCRSRCETAELDFFIVYFVWRRNWRQTVDTLVDLVGRPHPRMAVMIDVESWGGELGGDQSPALNRTHRAIGDWLGNPRRVIGYGNVADLDRLWPVRPAGLRLTVAAYGTDPDYPGQLAHQYTDGGRYVDAANLPRGAAPFGPCDMNVARGLDSRRFAAACGIDVDSARNPPGALA